jgi:hypothetical protein
MHTKVIFRVNPDDAKPLAAVFPERISGEGAEYETHASTYLLERGSDDPLVKEFINVYLRPLQGFRKGHHVEIHHRGADPVGELIEFAGIFAGASPSKVPIKVEDPLPYMDHLLYEVMRTKNPLLPIPYEAVRGLSSCNGGFFGAIRFVSDHDLSGEVRFPAHLANRTARGYVWLRRPEGDREKLWHCIFHLRMVMISLAQNPIVKSGKTPTIDFAQILIQLPVRMALVKSGDDVGQITTNHTPPPLVDTALQARRFFIQEHTRQRYCHPRAQIEHLIDDTTPPDEFSLRRWEEVDDGHVSGSTDS